MGVLKDIYHYYGAISLKPTITSSHGSIIKGYNGEGVIIPVTIKSGF